MNTIIITVKDNGYEVDKYFETVHTYTFFEREDIDIVKYIDYYIKQNYAVEVHY